MPRSANSYEIDENGALTARLATSEFLIESTETASEASVGSVRSALHSGEYPKGVYPVLRSDFLLEISGAQSEELFLQTCAVDLAPVARASTASAGPIVMTSMIGVAVVLACRQMPGGTRFTVWSDPSYSTYFHSQLQAIAADVIGRY
jgi:sarcosine oxidase gamma subunit